MSNADVFVRIVKADTLDEARLLLTNSRNALKAWVNYYARNEARQQEVVKTRILVEQIDLWLIRTSQK